MPPRPLEAEQVARAARSFAPNGAALLVQVLCALWILWAAAATAQVAYFCRWFPANPRLAEMARTVVIVPVKDVGPYLAAFFEKLRAQRHANARVLVVVESDADPAVALAEASAAGPGLPLEIVVAGLAPDMGQKVWNLRAALRRLEPDDAIVAFLDADTMIAPDWLAKLVEAIVQGRAEMTSCYRWIIPFGDDAGTLMAAAVDHAVATIPRWRPWNLAWGGSCALRRDILQRIDLDAWWSGAISDDMQLTRALWANGLKVFGPCGLLVASPAAHTMASAFEFGRRQYVMVRTHLPSMWVTAALYAGVPAAFFAVALYGAAAGDRFAALTLLLVFGIGLIRFRLRRRLDAIVRGEVGIEEQTSAWRMWCATLVAPVLNIACLVGSLATRRVHWSGVDYVIDAPQKVRVHRTAGAAATAPTGGSPLDPTRVPR